MVVSKVFEPPDLAIATLSGVVTSSDQADVIAWVRDSIHSVGPLHLLILLDLFGGWHPPDSFEDSRVWLRDDEGVAKMAIVGAWAWRRTVLTFLAQPLRDIPIEYFNSESAARDWLQGGPANAKKSVSI
jgi:SpoIIAA-like